MENKKYQLLHDLKSFIFYIILPLAIVILIGIAFNGNGDKESPRRQISNAESIENYKDANEGKAHKEKCGWCGGVGKVGYAGASEAQCRRTGMGYGNYCTTCQGTGTVKARN